MRNGERIRRKRWWEGGLRYFSVGRGVVARVKGEFARQAYICAQLKIRSSVQPRKRGDEKKTRPFRRSQSEEVDAWNELQHISCDESMCR
jgi:hypothetical protein